MVEDYGWDVVVVQMFFWFVVKQVFGEMMVCGYGDWCQFNGVGIIVYCVDVWYVGVLEFINDDVFFIVGFNVCCCQIEVVGCWFVVNCLDQVVNGLVVVIFQFQCQVVVGIFYYCFWDCIGMQLWVFGVYYFYQGFNDQWIEIVQWCVFVYEQVGFGVEVVNYFCQFNGDIVCVDYCYVFWQCWQFEEIVGINIVFDVWNIWVVWLVVGGDQDMVSGDDFVVDFYGVGIDKVCEVFDYVDFIFIQYVVVRGMNMVDIGVMVGDQFFLVKMVDGGIEIVVWVVKMNCFVDLCCMLYYFFWYVVDVDVGVVQFFGFNQCVFLVVYGCVVN